MTRDYWCLVLVIASLIMAPTSSAQAGKSPPDSIDLYGTWRWIESTGGLLGARNTPDNSGYERFLAIRSDGTYEFVERESKHEYLLCQGSVTIHRGKGLRAQSGWWADFWISFQDWWQPFEQDQLIHFDSHNRLITYPGSPRRRVADALSHRYARVKKPTNPDSVRLPLSDRPRSGNPSDLPGEDMFPYYEEPPVVITRVEPVYPNSPREPGTAAVVNLHVLVGKDGLVKNVKVIRGVTGYNVLAVEAVKKWIYKPALSNNKPVAVWIEVPVRFGP